jgi:hypothetical protein
LALLRVHPTDADQPVTGWLADANLGQHRSPRPPKTSSDFKFAIVRRQAHAGEPQAFERHIRHQHPPNPLPPRKLVFGQNFRQKSEFLWEKRGM